MKHTISYYFINPRYVNFMLLFDIFLRLYRIQKSNLKIFYETLIHIFFHLNFLIVFI